MSEHRFDVVLIDFFGTIADGDARQVELTCSHIVRDCGLAVSVSELSARWGKQFFAISDQSNHSEFRTLHECECVSLRRTLQELGVDCDPTPYADELQRYWCNPPLHGEAKDALASLPVPVCCVSNADEEDLQSAIEAHALKLDGLVSSERARSYKPDRAIFEYALKLMGAAPGRVLHVGDSLHSDVGGAQSLGIATAWIKRDGRISDIGTSRPDYTIGSLLELDSIVR